MFDSLKTGDEVLLDKLTLERLHQLHDSDIRKIYFDRKGADVVIEIELCQCYSKTKSPHMLAEISFENCDKIEGYIEPREKLWDVCIVRFLQLSDGSWKFETHSVGMNNGYVKIVSPELPKLKAIKELRERIK